MRQRSVTSSTSSVVLALLLVAIVIVPGGLLGLWVGKIWPFSKSEVSRAGQIAIPAPIRQIQAFQPVTRADLIDPATGLLNLIWVDERVYRESMLRDLGQIVGRVMAKDKNLGVAFQETDFLPPGTRPGITAGVPPGKRAMTVKADTIPGIDLLFRGDRFDIMTVLPEQDPSTQTVIEYARLLGGIRSTDAKNSRDNKNPRVKVLVDAGTVVALTQGKLQSTQGAAVLPTVPTTTRREVNKPELNVTIAIDPSETATLTEALSSAWPIYCVARSGHAEDQSGRQEAVNILSGLVGIPAISRSIPAYSAITQDDLADPTTGQLNVFYFQPDKISSDWISDPRQLIGRVVHHDVMRGAILSEDDFLPEGTPAGLSAGTPAGKTMVVIPVEKVEGLKELRPGENFAIFLKLPKESLPVMAGHESSWAKIMGGKLAPNIAEAQADLRSGVRAIVQDGLVVTKVVDGEKLAVAVTPTEARSLFQFMGEGASLQAVLKSRISAEERPRQDSPQASGGSLDSSKDLSETDRSEILPVSASQELAPVSSGRPVPVLTRNVRANEKLSVEDFIDPATGEIRTFIFPDSQVSDDWLDDVRTMVDRIVKRDIPAGRVIQRELLYPEGWKSGVAAGIPSGFVGFPLTTRQVVGLGGLQRGQQIALVAAQRRQLPEGLEQRTALNSGNLRDEELRQSGFGQPDVSVVTQHALLVELSDPFQTQVTETQYRIIEEPIRLGEEGQVIPARTIREPVTTTYQVTQQDCVLALSPEDATRLQAAIASGFLIQALAASGAADVKQKPTDGQERSDEHFADQLNFNSSSSRIPPLIAPTPFLREHIRKQERSREVWLKDQSVPNESVLPKASSLKGSQG